MLFSLLFTKIPHLNAVYSGINTMIRSVFNTPLHPEGEHLAFLSLSTLALSWFFLPVVITIALIPLVFLVIFFFRHPKRQSAVPVTDHVILSPADGTIDVIAHNVKAPAELNLGDQLFTRLSIFLSIFDVHVNRIPVNGTVIDRVDTEGSNKNAISESVATKNQRVSLVIETATGSKVICVQITGAGANRIICDFRPGDTTEAGLPYGIIKFGSRVDLYVEPGALRKDLKLGARLRGGESCVGFLQEVPSTKKVDTLL